MSQIAPRFALLLLTIAVSALVSCSKPVDSSRVDLHSGLIAQWPGQPDTARTLSEPTLTGGVTFVSNATARTLQFAGNGGRVLVSNAPSLNFGANRSFSIVARIKPERANTPFGVMSIVEKRKTGNITAAVGYSLHLEDGRLACQLAPFVRRSLTPADFTSLTRARAAWAQRNQVVPMKFARFISSGPDLRDGRWHDVALTVERRAANGGKLFVDGQVVLTFDPRKCSATLVNSEPLLIGSHPDPGLACGFKGAIKDVRLYSRALSQYGVEALHQQHQQSRRPRNPAR